MPLQTQLKAKVFSLVPNSVFYSTKYPQPSYWYRSRKISAPLLFTNYFKNLYEFWKANQWSCSGINILTRPSQAWVQNITALQLLEQFKISLFSPNGKKSPQHPLDNHNQDNNFFLHNLSTWISFITYMNWPFEILKCTSIACINKAMI